MKPPVPAPAPDPGLQWNQRTAAAHADLLAACQSVAQTQAALLLSIVRANTDTAFGHEHRFRTIQSVSDFQHQVPVADAEQFAPWIEQIAAGTTHVLTAEPVLRLTPTSGTSGEPKWIPCTQSLLHEFQRGVSAWLHDLFNAYPQVLEGTMYWAISPASASFASRRSLIPVGFAADADYLAAGDAALLAQKLAVPPDLAEIESLESLRYTTLLFLIADEQLRLISVWNPSFLTQLLEAFPPAATALIHDLRHGTLTPPVPLPLALQERITRHLRPQPGRAECLERLLSTIRQMPVPHPAELPQTFFTRLWPHLAVISCWTDAWAAAALPALQRLLPGVAIQPKGLLATEAFVTLPLATPSSGTRSAASANAPSLTPGAPVLAVRSHFFEFEAVATGQIHLAHELTLGAEYTVLVTTGGGLYRYRLNDRVCVIGFLGEAPRLKFLGKCDGFSDLCGEKLAERHISEALHALDWPPQNQPAGPGFGFLVPAPECDPPRYQFLHSSALPSTFADALDLQLQANPHYRYARHLGQLGSVEAIRLPAAAADAYQRLQARRSPLATAKIRRLEAPGPWQAWLTQPPGTAAPALAAIAVPATAASAPPSSSENTLPHYRVRL